MPYTNTHYALTKILTFFFFSAFEKLAAQCNSQKNLVSLKVTSKNFDI